VKLLERAGELINTQFALAVQIMTLLAATPDIAQSSPEIAARLGKHPAFLRRISSQLVRAGLLHASHGGGYILARPADTITLGNVYSAVVHRPYVDEGNKSRHTRNRSDRPGAKGDR
jgi:DNA-binding IscR family transcriptional regulator